MGQCLLLRTPLRKGRTYISEAETSATRRLGAVPQSHIIDIDMQTVYAMEMELGWHIYDTLGRPNPLRGLPG